MPIYVGASAQPWSQLKKQLATLLAFGTLARRGMFIPLLRDVAQDLLNWMVREYTGKSNREWKRISPWTYALSRRRVVSPLFLNPNQQRRASHYLRRNKNRAAMRSGGRTRRAPISLVQLATQAKRAMPLIDRGATRASLIRGRPFNVFQVSERRAVVGSSSPILVKHQTEHAESFVFDDEKQRLLKKNVPPKVGQRWNTLYFILRGAMRKASGRSVTIPARPMPTKPPIAIVNKLKRGVRDLVVRAVRSAFNT